MKDAICVFPDTNVLLHFPPINDIDWCAICDAKAVQLVACLTVIHELDAKKTDPRLSSRAERAIKQIRQAQKAGLEVRDGVTITIFNKEIRAVDFPDTLSPDSSDDRIVHLAKLFQQENLGQEVAIATADFGMELRAQAAGVAIVAMDSALRLPNPDDDLTKKHRQVVNELAAIKNRQPRLSLALARPGGVLEAPHDLIFELDNSWKLLDLNAEMQRVQLTHPKQGGGQTQGDKSPGPGSIRYLPGVISVRSWEHYDKELDQYYAKYRKHFELLNLVESAKSRSFSFDLWLRNEGSGLATDIDVLLSFPAQVRFVGKKGTEECEFLEKTHEPPEAPKMLPSFGGSPMLDVAAMLGRMPAIPSGRRDDWRPVASVNRKDDEICEIRVQLGKLKHGHDVCLGKFITVFGSWEEIGPFHGNYSISTSDLTNKVTGQLPFIARKKTDNSDK